MNERMYYSSSPRHVVLKNHGPHPEEARSFLHVFNFFLNGASLPFRRGKVRLA